MKLTSARVAWHDAFYTPEFSRTQSAREQMELGCQVQHSSKLNTCNTAVNHALAGVIQSAIAMLPVPLQMVGHWLYAPIDTGSRYERDVLNLVASKSGVPVDNLEMMALAHASIYAYQDLVIGKPDSVTLMNYPLRIHKWILKRHGIAINSKIWSKRYKPQWDRCISSLDEMDRRALNPVAAAINEANTDVCDDEYFVWGDHIVTLKRKI